MVYQIEIGGSEKSGFSSRELKKGELDFKRFRPGIKQEKMKLDRDLFVPNELRGKRIGLRKDLSEKSQVRRVRLVKERFYKYAVLDFGTESWWDAETQ